MILRPRLAAARLLLLLAPVSACASDSPAGSTPPPASATSAPPGWTLVFSDEFDTPGALDPAKWAYEIGYIRNDEKQSYTSRSENVRAEGGNLVIEGRKEAYQGYGYTSARVDTLGRFEFLYGRVEVRAKLPTGQRHVAGHLDARDEHRPGRAGPPAARSTSWRTSASTRSASTAASTPPPTTTRSSTQKTANVTVANPWEDFHVYAMEWYADHVDVFVDGQKYFTFRTRARAPAPGPSTSRSTCSINLAIGGSWGGQKGIDDSRFPHRYLVDYVRIYKQG